MKKKIKKRIVKKVKNKVTGILFTGILTILFFIPLVPLISEEIQETPSFSQINRAADVDAYIESFDDLFYELPKKIKNEKKQSVGIIAAGPDVVEQLRKIGYQVSESNYHLIYKIFSNDSLLLLVNKYNDYKKSKNELITNKSEETKNDKIVITKEIEKKIEKAIEKKELSILNEDESHKEELDVASLIDTNETIGLPDQIAEDITYSQILENPNDVGLNLKYAKQQSMLGDFEQTISILEKLNMENPNNIEVKLYYLSVLEEVEWTEEALDLIEEIKNIKNIKPSYVEIVNQIAEDLQEQVAPKLWNTYASISLGGTLNNNVNSVPKTRRSFSYDEIYGSNSAKHDQTYTSGLGLTATRSLGEVSSFMMSFDFLDSSQQDEISSYESYGLNLSLDTSYGNQSLSPYLYISKTNNQQSADGFSSTYGIGGSFDAGERNSFNYSYSFTDSKSDLDFSNANANDSNSITNAYTLGYDFYKSEITSMSAGLGYSDSDAKDNTSDYETYDVNFRLNFNFPWAYISIGESLSFNDYQVVDTSVVSSKINSNVSNTLDMMISKAVGDFLPIIDPNKNLSVDFSYDKTISEGNIMNNDYIADSFSINFSKSFSAD